MTQYANYDQAGIAADLTQYTPRMGRGLELFYGIIDNILITGEAGKEKTEAEETQCLE